MLKAKTSSMLIEHAVTVEHFISKVQRPRELTVKIPERSSVTIDFERTAFIYEQSILF